MKTRNEQGDERGAEAASLIGLEQAVARWGDARHAAEEEPCPASLSRYNAATNELGQALVGWQTTHPALAEQIRYFFARE